MDAFFVDANPAPPPVDAHTPPSSGYTLPVDATPPPSPEDRQSTGGRYAPSWNAYLLIKKLETEHQSEFCEVSTEWKCSLSYDQQ